MRRSRRSYTDGTLRLEIPDDGDADRRAALQKMDKYTGLVQDLTNPDKRRFR